MQLLVQLPYSHHIRLMIISLQHCSVLHCVVKGYDAPATHQHKALLIVVVVTFLVSVDESEVKSAGLTLVDQPLEAV